MRLEPILRRTLALCLGALPAALVILMIWPERPAEAIPAFAREYRTSCSTCHVAFPALTPFGEAFRRNGYRFPGGEDADASWDEPIPLGQPAHRRVFPDAIWPGETPGTLPIAATLSAQTTWLDANGDFDSSFAQAGGRAGIIVAGALDTVFSAWAGLAVSAALEDGREVFEAELERVFLVTQPFDEPWLNVRFGRFEPGLMGVTVHRTLGPAPWILTTPVADSGFSVDPTQLGIEATGVLPGGRLNYSVGVFDGSGNLSDPGPDLYARLGYKFGGMRLDGIGGAQDALPWRDGSLQIGVFGLLGRETVGDPDLATQGDDFQRVGADLNAIVWDLNLQVAYAFQRNDQPLLREPGTEVESHFAFAQLLWVAYPWLLPSVRYELRNMGEADTENRIVPAVYFLIRQNIRAQLIGELGGAEQIDLDQLTAGVNVAF